MSRKVRCPECGSTNVTQDTYDWFCHDCHTEFVTHREERAGFQCECGSWDVVLMHGKYGDTYVCKDCGHYYNRWGV